MLHLDFRPFPVLSTPRLSLRQITYEDAPALFDLRTDARVMRYIPKPLLTDQKDIPNWIGEIQRLLDLGDAILWGISEKGTSALIGTIGYWRIVKEHHRAELGYTLKPTHWRQGLMKEAVATVLDHGWRIMRLHSVEAQVTPDNKGSIAVLEQNGFVKEAHLKQNIRFNEVFRDTVIYSKLTPTPR